MISSPVQGPVRFRVVPGLDAVRIEEALMRRMLSGDVTLLVGCGERGWE